MVEVVVNNAIVEDLESFLSWWESLVLVLATILNDLGDLWADTWESVLVKTVLIDGIKNILVVSIILNRGVEVESIEESIAYSFVTLELQNPGVLAVLVDWTKIYKGINEPDLLNDWDWPLTGPDTSIFSQIEAEVIVVRFGVWKIIWVSAVK